MNNKSDSQRLQYKKLLFEYIVFRLYAWKDHIGESGTTDFTKLRLQKILFLVCAWNASIQNKGLLNTFDNFAALPYGPVELDIYDSMCGNLSFSHITFEGNNCKISSLNDGVFTSLKTEDKYIADDAIESFKQRNYNYITCPVFDLVEITHRWTVWQVAMSIAEMMGSKKEVMSTEDICNSAIKAF